MIPGSFLLQLTVYCGPLFYLIETHELHCPDNLNLDPHLALLSRQVLLIEIAQSQLFRQFQIIGSLRSQWSGQFQLMDTLQNELSGQSNQ